MWLLLVRSALVTFALSPVGTAPSDRPIAEVPGFSLTVSPSRIIVPADQTGRPREFVVSNNGRSPVDVVGRMAKFAAGADGLPVLHGSGAEDWAYLTPKTFSLAGGESRRVRLVITVPATAEPGEQPLAVVFTAPGADSAAGITVDRAIAAAVYIRVAGPTVDLVRGSDLRAPKFATRGPIDLVATVQNQGTIHRDFVGTDRLTARVDGTTVPFPDVTLLRDSSRQVTTRWANPPLWCVCPITVTVTNPDGSSDTSTATTVIVPLHLIGPGVAFLGALVLLMWLTRRRRRPLESAAVGSPSGQHA